MIIKAFSDYLREFKSDIPAVVLLSRWLKEKLSREPESNIDMVIHTEIVYLRNKTGLFMFVGRSNTGRILLESLYNFALSYEQQNFSRWLHNLKASDFESLG